MCKINFKSFYFEYESVKLCGIAVIRFFSVCKKLNEMGMMKVKIDTCSAIDCQIRFFMRFSINILPMSAHSSVLVIEVAVIHNR